jgi:hypothetical protein
LVRSLAGVMLYKSTRTTLSVAELDHFRDRDSSEEGVRDVGRTDAATLLH